MPENIGVRWSPVCIARDAIPALETLRLDPTHVLVSYHKFPQEWTYRPFFTIKSYGKGTGLGLSMAHRFASTHGSRISIKTAPGQSTTVRLFLSHASDAESG